MWQMALSLLLVLSVYQSDIKDAKQAREAKNTIIEQGEKVEKPVIKQDKAEKKDALVKRTSSEQWMRFEISAYTNGRESTGKSKGDKYYGITASGKHTKEGRTVAADPRVLPMGTVIYIDGIGERIVEDTGSAIKGYKLDLFIEDLKEAREFGRKKNIKVKIVKRVNK